MKRKYRLILIILISALLTYIIFIFNQDDKINLVALGDGISSGETSYNIDGISYNDYLKEYFDSKNLLNNYNNNFAIKNYKLIDLFNNINNNIIDKKTNKYIEQIIHKADIITISIGEDELTKLEMTNDLEQAYLKEFISNYDKLIKTIKSITEAKIVVIGLYENNYLDKSNVIIINSELGNIAIKYDIIFINVSDLLLDKDYYLNKNSYYFSYKGHEAVSEIIIHSL